MEKTDKRVSIGNWVGIFILMGIPIVNIIVLIVLLCSSNGSKRNYAIALVIMFLISCLLIVIFIFVILPLILSSLLEYLEKLMNSDLIPKAFKSFNKILSMAKII